MLLKDKICIVTGASRGIGRSVAELFASEGAKVYAMDIANLDWVKPSFNIVPLVVDLCDFKEVKQKVMEIYKGEGRIDVLANIAGLISYEFMPMIDYDKFRNMMEVNVISLVHITDLVSRLMRRTGGGSIVNMASKVGVNGAKGQLSYSATKGAVVALTKSAAKELAEYNIRVNAIAPAMVETERFKTVVENQMKDSVPNMPFGRMAQPIEVAQACLFLASDQSSYVTGQILGVDGGIVI